MITPQPIPLDQAKALKLLDQVRDNIRLKHYSKLIEQAYVDWIKRFVLFNKSSGRNGGVFDAFGGGREGCVFNAKSGQGGGVIFVFKWFVNF